MWPTPTREGLPIRKWLTEHPYLADHPFLYVWCIGAVVTGIWVLFGSALDWNLAQSATVDQLSEPVQLLWAICFALGGMFGARGVREAYAPSEVGGCVMLAACSFVIAFGRAADNDPVAGVAFFSAVGLLVRAFSVMVGTYRSGRGPG